MIPLHLLNSDPFHFVCVAWTGDDWTAAAARPTAHEADADGCALGDGYPGRVPYLVKPVWEIFDHGMPEGAPCA